MSYLRNNFQTEKYAKRLVGCSAYLFRSEIIDEPENPASIGLIGYMVVDDKNYNVGKVIQIDDYSGNIVLTVVHNGNELLIPFNEDFVIEIDDTLKKIKLQLPEGLFDL